MIERFLGVQIPKEMVSQSFESERQAKEIRFDDDFTLAWPKDAPSAESELRVASQNPLRQCTRSAHGPFLDFVEALLRINPEERPSAETASLMPFIVGDALPE